MYVFVNSPAKAPRDQGARLRSPGCHVVHGRLMFPDEGMRRTAVDIYALAFSPPMFRFPSHQAAYEFEVEGHGIGSDFVIEFRRRRGRHEPKRRGRREWDALRSSDLTSVTVTEHGRCHPIGPGVWCFPRAWVVDMLYNDERQCAGSVVMPIETRRFPRL